MLLRHIEQRLLEPVLTGDIINSLFIDVVQRAIVYRQRSLVYGFAQARMCVYRALKVLCTCREFHREDGF